MECSSREMTGVHEIFDRAITIAVGDEYKCSSRGGSSAGSGPALGGKRKKNRSCKFL